MTVSGGETVAGDTSQWGVGGLVGHVQSGEVLSSHATGNVTFRKSSGNWDSQGRRYVGGLVGWNQGTIYAAYSWGNVRTTENRRSNDSSGTFAGGLIGNVGSGATVRAGYATGSVSRTNAPLGDWRNRFGSSVGNSDGTINYVYGSGAVTTSGTEQNPTGTSKQTESALKSPTGYTGIYANWNFDIDNADGDDTLTTGTDDPWHFGTASQLPVFDYTPEGGTALPPAQLQPASLTLTASSTTIAEGDTTTITAALGSAKTYAVRVTQPDGENRYTYDITVAAGSTSATGTFTSVENTSPTSDLSVALTASRTYPANQVTIVSTSSTIAVQDDEIHGVSNVAASQAKQSDNTYDITVTWDAPGTENTRNATAGYDLEYKISTDTTWTSVTVSAIATVTHDIEGVTASKTYEIRMRAKSSTLNGAYSSTASVAVGDDYDADDDGLIDVGTLAQLNAIRYDLNADGSVSSTDETNYLAAFTNAMPGMGCPSAGCTGYELRANLDFNTNNSAKSSANPTGADSGDTYWNNGAGWTPIGGATTYTGAFDGNNDTDASGDGGPYKISNLFINATSGQYFGLFGRTRSGTNAFEYVALENVSITRTGSSSTDIDIGGLAGRLDGEVMGSWTTGRVRAGYSSSNKITMSAASKYISVGGLAGQNGEGNADPSEIVASYSTADVTAYVDGNSNHTNVYVGGLVGDVYSEVDASYGGGDVTVTLTNPGSGSPTNVGGLAGRQNDTSAVRASYARGAVNSTSASGGLNFVGGLIGLQQHSVTATFSTGAVTATGGSTNMAGGLVGLNSGTTTYSYWDTETSGVSTGSGGTGKTTSELQTPTAYGTGANDIYKDWNLNLDGQTGNDDPWDFGTANQYPTLKYGNQVASDQRAIVTLSASPSTIWESNVGGSTRATSSTVTATLDTAWNVPVVVTLPTNAAYSWSASTITIAAGATTGTATLSAVNNYVDASNATVTLTQATHPTATKWIVKGTDVSITINDDDELDKPTGVKLSVDGAKIRVDWTAVNNAEGYKVQWSTDSTFATVAEGTVSSGSTVTYTIDPTPALSANTRYYVRVLPTKTGADEPPSDTVDTTTHATGANATVDYDADNDGLIEITTLAQLNAIRYDLDGNGQVASGDQTSYDTAFPNAEDNMGCNESAVTIASNNTGNPACTGYELSANLDFNTNNSATSSANPTGADSGDTYWNGGSGWDPIGGTSGSSYTGDFDGNTYTISNLFIDRSSGNYAGLFAKLDGASGKVVKNVSLVNVDVTLNPTTSDNVYVGGLAGYSGTEIEDSYTTGRVRAGESASEPVTFNSANDVAYVGGLVGQLQAAAVTGSYSQADVTTNIAGGSNAVQPRAGGLVGYTNGAGASVDASYAAGDVTVSIVSTGTSTAMAGGLVGDHSGTGDGIRASYARGDVSATISSAGNGHAGGLAGNLGAGSTITASFSTGAVTRAITSGDFLLGSAGGLVGFTTTGTATNSYWDTATSGVSASAVGTGKTTSQLQSPVGYTGDYANWNLNLDGVTGNDDPWAFGTASQYPVLKYGGQTASQQRVTVTLTVSPSTIWESTVGDSTRATSATLTVTPSSAWDKEIVATLPNFSSYTLGASSVTIPAGSTTAQTATLTAVNDYIVNALTRYTLTLTADSPWVTIGAAPTVTISDDDELTKPTGVRLSVDGTKIRVDWTQVTGATGYKVQWNSTSSTSWASPSEGTVSSGSTTTYTIDPTPALTANTRYYVRVLPTKSGADEPPSDVVDTTTHATSPATVDYDADNDGLIEVSTLAQLNAMRWDLNGNGVVDDASNQTTYDTAFPNAEDNMGCNESAVSIASNNTGNPACTGYELRANLNFDTGTAGDRTDDTYYNSGAGWTPIGDDTTAFTGDFDGNSDTDASGDGGPYTITNLHINLSSTSGLSYAGLFGVIGTGAEVENVALTGVSVTGSTTADGVYAGALAGRSQGTIEDSYSLGAVAAHRTGTGTTDKAYAGGLVGQNSGTIRASYSRASVTAGSHTANEGHAGGLVGRNDSGATIAASYARGSVTSNRGTDTTGTILNSAYAGGLVSSNDGTIIASYASGSVTGVGRNVDAGGLVGTMTLATVTASFSTGSVTATITGGTETTGGLIGSAPPSATITDSYWDTQTSGITETGYGTGKTTSELQTPTSETGIYVNWDVNVDGVTGDDDPWDFGTAGQYPVLDFGAHTVNNQRAAVNVTLSPTTICESSAGTNTNACGANPVTSATLTVTPAAAWHEAITVTLPANAAVYTLSASSVTFTAGSTTAQTITVDAVNNKRTPPTMRR